MMTNLRVLACMLLLFCACVAQGQEEDDPFKRYEAFRGQAVKRYDNFREEANRKYGQFQEEAWKRFSATPAVPKPKDEEVPPVTIPDDEIGRDKEDSKPVVIREVVTPPAPEPQPVPVSPIEETPVPTPSYSAFTFYGTDCRVRTGNSTAITLGDCSNDKLTTAWGLLADGSYDNTIIDLLALRKDMQLSDWAYLNMINTYAESILGRGNEATFLTAFIYCQSGYRMRIGRDRNKLCLLFASKYEIYELAYFVIDGVNYYPYRSAMGSMEIYDMPYPKEKAMSLLITTGQLFTYDATAERTLTSERYPDMSVTLSVNKNAIDFFDSYPSSSVDNDFMTRWAMYADTPLDEKVREVLYPVVERCTAGLSQQDAANKIINWVQTAFVYEYDNKVWGHDRAFFAEETLYYPYCDCEDRAILFSHLIRDIIGLDVLLVYYPGHLATAVAFTENVDGDYITFEGRNYTISDPTFIGAPVGWTMTGMDNASVRVCRLSRH